MPLRHPLPPLWLVTDERQDGVLAAAERLPRGSGILFRHYRTAPAERRALFRAVRSIARRRGHRLLLADRRATAAAWGADGWHGSGRGAHSRSVHDLAELRRAEREGVRMVFVSPVYPTRSHPGACVLGVRCFAALVRSTHLPAIALGGVTWGNAAPLLAAGAYGWAGIDAWSDAGA